jgi:hypothetical protein
VRPHGCAAARAGARYQARVWRPGGVRGGAGVHACAGASGGLARRRWRGRGRRRGECRSGRRARRRAANHAELCLGRSSHALRATAQGGVYHWGAGSPP